MAHEIVRLDRFIEQAGRLEILIEVNVAALTQNSTGKQPINLSRIFMLQFEDNFFLFGKTSVFALKTFNWLDEVHSHYGGLSASLEVY